MNGPNSPSSVTTAEANQLHILITKHQQPQEEEKLPEFHAG